jgi:hypothetical protein
MKRYTCIICKRKRYEQNMKNVFGNSWACTDKYMFQYCCDNKEIYEARIIIEKLKTFKHIGLKHLSTISTAVNVTPELTISRDKE